MGVILPAAATLVALLGAAVATAWLEPRLPIRQEERGPVGVLRYDSEPVLPRTDPWMYGAAPFVALLAVCWGMVVVPFGPALVGGNLNIGLFYFIVVVDLLVVAIAMGGWGANTPGAVEGCYRVVAQLIAYVVPLGLAILGPVMMARSLATVDIVEAQQRAGFPYLIAQPLGFGLYIVTGLMQVYRAPFLEPFAARIDGGILAVYGGWRAFLWRLALSGVLFLVAAIGSVLFLAGHAAPFAQGPAAMIVKVFLLMVLMLWVGRRIPLLGTADMLALSWKLLIPAGLLNVLLVGALILLGVGQP